MRTHTCPKCKTVYRWGSESVCACVAERRVRTREQIRRWRESRRVVLTDRHLRTSYGITLDQFEELERQQGFACACCQRKPSGRQSRLYVDVDKVTKKLRGLICRSCITGLGVIGDSPASIARVLQYLERIELPPLVAS